MNTLLITICILAAAVLGCFLAGVATRNYSHVDRLWSILPAVYGAVWLGAFFSNWRFVIPFILIVLWSVRLTANFALKGGYRFSFARGFYEEDYRWAVLKKKIPNRFAFELFNLGFISFYQLALVFGFTLPLYFLGSITGPITSLEMGLYALHALLLTGETAADIGQLRYYARRENDAMKRDRRVQLGFNTYGLWKFSRHPNYLFEMSQWVVVYLYLHVAGGGFHWSLVFPVLLILLFVGSTRMAEQITQSKYPAYAAWKKATPPWVPFWDFPFRRAHRRQFFARYVDNENEPADLPH